MRKTSVAIAAALTLPAATPGLLNAGVDFTRDVRPVLESACLDCHDGETHKGELSLEDVHGILKGGGSGEPLYIKGKSAESSIIKHVTSPNPKEVMPPKGDKLTLDQIKILSDWIDAGAEIPGEAEAVESLRVKTDHWSFQPVQRPVVPPLPEGATGNEVDAFVLAGLKAQGLAASPRADRRTLIRRLYLTTHGLPPAPAEVERFVHDDSPGAWSQLVDAVLASPRYGERWARHWMDVVRYADTNGFETNRERKTAYPYRDWIIDSFNSDKPYDQFIREQIAGDALGADAATGFLVAGQYDIVKSPDISITQMQRQAELTDMVSTTGTAFMGLTLGCAQCHNHKFDPILQKDFYSMQAVFAGVNHGERPIRRKLDAGAESQLAALKTVAAARQSELQGLRDKAAAGIMSAQGKLCPAVNARENTETFPPVETTAVRFTITSSTGAEPCIDELEIYDTSGKNVALAAGGAIPSASGTIPGYAIHKLEHLNDGMVGNEHSWISNTAVSGWVEITFPSRTKIQRIVWSRDRNARFADRLATAYRFEGSTAPGEWLLLADSTDREPYAGKESPDDFLTRLSPADAAAARALQQEITGVQNRIADIAGSPGAWIGTFSQPEKTHRLYRGEPAQKREVVSPDALTVLGSLNMHVDEPEQQRRVKLANWIASPQHPLTARVMVNRLWHYIFGTGIVNTPGDFGKNGARPTHPELLDWLADEFVKSGWSLKHIQRLILMSQTFQQSSTPREEAMRADASGTWLWRFTPRRLEAEAIRDAMLSVSGALDLRMGGPGFYLMDVVEENVMHYFAKESFGPPEFRRMVYQFRIRQTTDSIFSSFDCPDGGQVTARRSRSNTPLQALNLFNSTFALQQANMLAAHLEKTSPANPSAQIHNAFHLFYARPADEWEHQNSLTMIQKEGLPAFCRALYNTSEFLFVF